MKAVILSDIHLKAENEVNSSDFSLIKKQFTSFILFLKAKHPKLDYLILNGDIASSGNAEEYKLFKSLLIEPLKDKYKDIKILSVPGNHDINWGKTSFLLNSLGSEKSTYSKRSEILSGYFKKFEKSFANYKTFIEDNHINTISTGMDESLLFGYQIDFKNKIVFILVNSSWFSIGSKFNNYIVTHCKKYRLSVSKALEIKDKIAEFGNQMIADNHISNMNLREKVFSKHPHFTYITLMHHPLHWLSWNEIYGTDKQNQSSKSLYSILTQSNFLFTGHEHVPPHVKSSQNYTGVHHIPLGCFLEEFSSETRLTNIRHNRFSVIEIQNNRKNTFQEKKYVFNYMPNQHYNPVNILEDIEWNDAITFYPKTNYDFDLIINTPLLENRLHELIKSLLNSDIKEITAITIKGKTYHSCTSNDVQNYFHFIDNLTPQLFDKTFEEVDSIVSQGRSHKSSDKILIHFVIFDYLDLEYKKKIQVISGIPFKYIYLRDAKTKNEKIYSNLNNNERENMLHKEYQTLVNKLEALFNTYKHNYFMRYESDVVGNYQFNDSLNTLNKIGLVLHVIPFNKKFELL